MRTRATAPTATSTPVFALLFMRATFAPPPVEFATFAPPAVELTFSREVARDNAGRNEAEPGKWPANPPEKCLRVLTHGRLRGAPRFRTLRPAPQWVQWRLSTCSCTDGQAML